MIDESLQKVLSEIEAQRRSYKAWEDSAKKWRFEEEEAREKAERDEAGMKEVELKIEHLSLELRKVLNGKPSKIPVDLPQVGEPVQIGREG